jgi:hypothetical protein
VPDNWACPACALLGARGATHIYLLEQPYERQDVRRMTRVGSNSDTIHVRPEVHQEPRVSASPEISNQGIPQLRSVASVRPKSREPAKIHEWRSFVNRLSMNSSTTPKVAELGNAPGNGPLERTDLTFVGQFGVSPDADGKIEPMLSSAVKL